MMSVHGYITMKSTWKKITSESYCIFTLHLLIGRSQRKWKCAYWYVLIQMYSLGKVLLNISRIRVSCWFCSDQLMTLVCCVLYNAAYSSLGTKMLLWWTNQNISCSCRILWVKRVLFLLDFFYWPCYLLVNKWNFLKGKVLIPQMLILW